MSLNQSFISDFSEYKASLGWGKTNSRFGGDQFHTVALIVCTRYYSWEMLCKRLLVQITKTVTKSRTSSK